MVEFLRRVYCDESFILSSLRKKLIIFMSPIMTFTLLPPSLSSCNKIAFFLRKRSHCKANKRAGNNTFVYNVISSGEYLVLRYISKRSNERGYKVSWWNDLTRAQQDFHLLILDPHQSRKMKRNKNLDFMEERESIGCQYF